MLIDATHRLWASVTLGLLVVATAAYVAYAALTPRGPSGGSLMGLLFGATGTALMIYAGLLAARKRLPYPPLGRTQTWLRGHIWLGSLSVFLIAYHSGFRLGGTLECVLCTVFAVIVISGVFGLALQSVLPRMLTVRAPHETFIAQLPHICSLLQLEADAVVADKCGPWNFEPPEGVAEERVEAYKHAIYQSQLSTERTRPRGWYVPEAVPGSGRLSEFYLRNVRPFLNVKSPKRHALTDAQAAAGKFAQLRAELADELRPPLDRLIECCDERRQLLELSKLHRLLHGWLWVHVPLCCVLLVLAAVHIATALYW